MLSTLILISLSIGTTRAVYMDNFEACNNTPVVILMVPKPPKDNIQEIDLRAYSPIPLGANTRVHAEVHIGRNNEWTKIWDLSFNDMCKFANRYGGKAWFDVERQMHIPPHVCPIPKINATTTNVMDWKAVGYTVFPKGQFKVHLDLLERKDNSKLACYTMFFKN